MAATATTRNKLNRARTNLYWLAQSQGHCIECGRKLVGKRLSSVDKLTVHHLSDNYDHARKRERGSSDGVLLMHARCHKSRHMRQNRVWEHRNNNQPK
jgi:hypothetical protein